MKNFLSTIVFGAIFIALAVLAFVSAPRGGDTARAESIDVAAQTSANVAGSAAGQDQEREPTVGEKFNFIGMPLDASTSMTTFNAQGLADYMGGSVEQILKWNASSGFFDAYLPGVDPPIPPFNFDLEVGGAYFILVDSTADTVLTFVGDVPDQGTISNDLVPAAGAGCRFNSLTIPLDQASVTTAQDLADAIGGVEQVLSWNAASQFFNAYLPGVDPPIEPFNFEVKIGYPYFICLQNAGPTSWP